jgi:murein DD-endopeptidase MepM/ murein hydrolase activator NlpD
VIGVLAALGLLLPGCYLPPVESPIVDPFRAPSCVYCAGNRGLEYRPAAGSRVVAAAGGVVEFNGVVAGVRYVVVRQVDGRLATYGRLAGARVAAGGTVGPGEVIGTTSERFYFGLREGDRYVDPEPFLAKPRYRPRLIPLDGSAPRRAPPPTMVCAATR